MPATRVPPSLDPRPNPAAAAAAAKTTELAILAGADREPNAELRPETSFLGRKTAGSTLGEIGSGDDEEREMRMRRRERESDGGENCGRELRRSGAGRKGDKRSRGVEVEG